MVICQGKQTRPCFQFFDVIELKLKQGPRSGTPAVVQDGQGDWSIEVDPQSLGRWSMVTRFPKDKENKECFEGLMHSNQKDLSSLSIMKMALSDFLKFSRLLLLCPTGHSRDIPSAVTERMNGRLFS
jgi:hypothetical protein